MSYDNLTDRLKGIDSGAESTVYLDPDQGAVYKVTNGGIALGNIRGGFGKLDVDRVRGSILDFLKRIDVSNRHGGLTYTETVGVTSDGKLVVKQPYISQARKSETLEKRDLLRRRNLGKHPAPPAGRGRLAIASRLD